MRTSLPRAAAAAFVLSCTAALAMDGDAGAAPASYSLAAFQPQAGPSLPVLRYDRDWLDALPEAAGGRDWRCLTEALYFEARGEPVKGQFAVAEVILNRVDAPGYPDTVCEVVHQASSRGCQFSYTCDGRADRIRDRTAAVAAGKIARLMLDGAPRVLTGGATHFHTRAVRPGWAEAYARTASIGRHLFYRPGGRT
jgi:spore germination cell wall hydrolase CwlJ-like protein